MGRQLESHTAGHTPSTYLQKDGQLGGGVLATETRKCLSHPPRAQDKKDQILKCHQKSNWVISLAMNSSTDLTGKTLQFLTLHSDAVPGGKDLDAFSLEGSNTLQGPMCGTNYTYRLSGPHSLRLEENKKMTRL